MVVELPRRMVGKVDSEMNDEQGDGPVEEGEEEEEEEEEEDSGDQVWDDFSAEYYEGSFYNKFIFPYNNHISRFPTSLTSLPSRQSSNNSPSNFIEISLSFEN